MKKRKKEVDPYVKKREIKSNWEHTLTYFAVCMFSAHMIFHNINLPVMERVLWSVGIFFVVILFFRPWIFRNSEEERRKAEQKYWNNAVSSSSGRSIKSKSYDTDYQVSYFKDSDGNISGTKTHMGNGYYIYKDKNGQIIGTERDMGNGVSMYKDKDGNYKGSSIR